MGIAWFTSGPFLYMCYDCQPSVLLGHLTVSAGVSLFFCFCFCFVFFFLPALGTFFLLLGCLTSSLNIRDFTLSYCILFCSVWLSSFGNLFSEEEMNESVRDKRWRGAQNSEGKDNCGQDICVREEYSFKKLPREAWIKETPREMEKKNEVFHLIKVALKYFLCILIQTTVQSIIFLFSSFFICK